MSLNSIHCVRNIFSFCYYSVIGISYGLAISEPGECDSLSMVNPLCGIQCITVYYLHKNVSLRLTYSTDGSVSRDVHLAGEFLRVGNDRDDSRISNFRQKLGSRPSLAAHVPHRIPGNIRKPRGIGCIEKSRDPGLDLSHSFFNYNLNTHHLDLIS